MMRLVMKLAISYWLVSRSVLFLFVRHRLWQGIWAGIPFSVLLALNSDQGKSDLVTLSKSIIDHVSQSYLVDALTLNIGCSIGVAMYPEFGLDAATSMKNADMAVYRAKSAGRATYYFYDGEMGKQFARNVRIETRLRQALQNERLELHFQPKVDLITEHCVGMEALLRWNDEELGRVSQQSLFRLLSRLASFYLWVNGCLNKRFDIF